MNDLGLWSHLRPPDRATAWILGLGVVLPVAYVQFGSPGFYREVPAPLVGVVEHPLAEMHARLYQFCAAFVLFFVIPTVVWRAVMGRGLRAAGLRVGDWRFGWRSLIVAVVLAIPLAYLSAGQADFQAEYP